MTIALWSLVTLLVSVLFGFLAGVLDLYSEDNTVIGAISWVVNTISYISFFGLAFFAVAGFFTYILHATGTFAVFVITLLVLFASSWWVECVSIIGIKFYGKYILKLPI